jgi:isocitrate/isopropylmalate dehydrogenase
MLLRYALKLDAEAGHVERAIEAVLRAGARTADLAPGPAAIGTRAMAARIVTAIEAPSSS